MEVKEKKKPNFIIKKTNPKGKGRNTKRGPTYKAKTMPKNEREQKAFAQIQIPNLSPKPLMNSVKQIKQSQRKELKKVSSLEKTLMATMTCLNLDEVGFFLRLLPPPSYKKKLIKEGLQNNAFS
jgi:hypothetical protein